MRGEKLQQLLDVNIVPLILERSLFHTSYLNEIRSNGEIEIQKAHIKNGMEIFKIALATLYAEETDSHKDINTKLEANKESVLIQFYKKYQLDDFLYIGKGEHQGRKEHYLEHCLILFYYIYKEEGFLKLIEILQPLYEQTKNSSEKTDYKSVLQEYVQAFKKTESQIKYETIKTEGPAHNMQFTVEVTAANRKGVGMGDSKKKAQQQAALNWFKINQIPTPTKKAPNPIKPIKKSSPPISTISNVRLNELNELYRNLNLSSNHLSLEDLDLCFTHKSYANEKRISKKDIPPLFTWFGSLVLPFLISSHIIDDFSNRASGSFGRMIELSGSMVSSSHLDTCLPESLYNSVRVSNNINLDSPTFKANIIQAILGGMFLNNSKKNQNDPFVNLKQFALNFIIKDVKDTFDYRSYLQIISQEVQANVKVKLDFSGQNHQMIHFAQVQISFPNIDVIIKGKSQAPSKKHSLNSACKDAISQLKKLYNLNQSDLDLPNTTLVNTTLSRFIQSALLKRSSLKFRELLGGLSLDAWSIASAENIINHLYKRQMLIELVTLLHHWEKLHGKGVVDECLLNLSSDDLEKIEIYRQKFKTRQDKLVETADELEDYLYLLSEELSLKPSQTKEKVIGQIGLKETGDGYEDLNDLEDFLDFYPS